MALTWDFARQLDAAASPGNTTNYFDTNCQAFYIDNGSIKTQIAELVNGQWNNIVRDPELVISDAGYSLLDIEHHFNDVVFGTAYHDGDIVFLVYEYKINISSYVQKGVLQLQPNNSMIAAILELTTVGSVIAFDSYYSIFAIGNQIDLKYRLNEDGDDTYWRRLVVQGNQYDDISEKTIMKAKNKLAIQLLSQTFDDERTYTGTLTEVVTAILTDASVDAFVVDTSSAEVEITFDADQTIFEGLSNLCTLYDWFVDSLADGTVIVGSDSFIQVQLPINTFTFVRGDDVFSRYVENNINNAYSRVCVRRTGANPLKVYAAVPTMEWGVPTKKTFYKDVPDDCEEGVMTALASQISTFIQYGGIIEVFTTAFRPELHIGDGCTVQEAYKPDLVGIITDVQHVFGEIEHHTQFTLYSGGPLMSNPASLTTKYIPRLGHMDRTQQLLNFISSPDKR